MNKLELIKKVLEYKPEIPTGKTGERVKVVFRDSDVSYNSIEDYLNSGVNHGITPLPLSDKDKSYYEKKCYAEIILDLTLNTTFIYKEGILYSERNYSRFVIIDYDYIDLYDRRMMVNRNAACFIIDKDKVYIGQNSAPETIDNLLFMIKLESIMAEI